MHKHILLLSLALIMGWALLGISTAHAQTPVPSVDDINAIARELYCPVCESIPLDVCPTQACEQWRSLIGEKLAQGWSEDQIKAYFVEQYGDQVVAEPPRRGLNWMVYILPPLMIVAGAVAILLFLRRMRRSAAPASLPVGQEFPDAAYVNRIESELARRTQDQT